MANHGLTPEQVEEFHENGVIHLGRVLNASEVTEAQGRFEAVFDAQSRRPGKHLRNLAARSFSDDDQKADTPLRMLQIMQMWVHDGFFRRLLFDPRLLDKVESLIGPDVRLFHDQGFYKPARHGGPVFFHQDNGYWHCEPPELVSIWIALDDVTEENGCLWMQLGSHRLGTADHRPTGSTALLETPVDTSRLVPFCMPAGHALLHHCLTVHGSHPNRSSRPRRAHAIHYMAEGTTRPDEEAFPTAENLILRQGIARTTP